MTGPAGPERVPFVGLTGGIGAGKSTALAALGELGAATVSTDEMVHELLATADLRSAIVERLGAGVVTAEGAIDRAAMAAHVFDHADDRAWLEGTLWPRVGAQVAAWRRQVESHDPPPRAAVVEVPLLFEAGMETIFDATIAVVSDEDVRSRRAATRGHAAVAQREGRQLTQEDKAARADYVVRNEGTPAELKAKLSQVLATIDR